MTVHVFATEQRTMIRAGKPPITITREVMMKNGHGRKTVRVARGSRVLSNVSEVLKPHETQKIGKRKYIRGLYKPAERRTMKRMRYQSL
jgi:hypothetical protein